jgi:hypothetical protein
MSQKMEDRLSRRNDGMARGAVTWVALNICYPDGRLKSAGWGGYWISDTEALIFNELDMSDKQQRLFRVRRRLRKPAWGNRPTLIRQKVIKPDEPICSVGEFQPSNDNQNCNLFEGDRGRVQKVTFNVSAGGRRYEAVLNEDLMLDTFALILSERAMSSDELDSFNRQPAAVAIRRLRTSAAGPPRPFELVCYDSSTRSKDAKTDSTPSCGRGKLPVKMIL